MEVEDRVEGPNYLNYLNQEGLDNVDGLDGLGESWRAGRRALFN